MSADLTSPLELERAKLERERLEFEQKKLQRMTIAVSIVALAVSGLQAFVAFKQSQLATAQTVERFIPYLQRGDTRDAALVTMSAFLEGGLVTQLADKLNATGALETLKTQGSSSEQKQATAALDAVEQRRGALVDRLFDASKPVRIQATAELIQQWRDDPRTVSQVLARAARSASEPSGTINSLVVLSNAPPSVLAANEAELQHYLDRVRGNGEQTAELVDKVRQRAEVKR
jgi:hypothetical protein